MAINREKPDVLLGIADRDLARRFLVASERSSKPSSVFTVTTLAELHEQMKRSAPRVIVVADDLLQDLPPTEILRQLIGVAPVILLAPQERQTEISKLVAGGDVEFVAQVGDFLPLAASLLERRSRWAERSEIPAGQLWGELSLDVAEIFRHEINNPLTGILGNAELVLAHGEHMSVTDAQRLRTIVDLAVRLRETTRRLTSSLQTQPHPLRSV
ncbi:MAG TPA: histidine kinase dimerization/phospho-acceptor domain-containing protein [Candidatus Acidoferrales bacterium]|nr:histidine kinase dimerization/phospho-acceptor domain-containing protein [Candidatus Acidoferrales bacterium]